MSPESIDSTTSSLAPAFLLSMPQLTDPNFSRTVVLLCKHNSEGAFGLVVNRPLVTAGRVVVNLDPPVETDRELQVWVGGPVEPQSSWMLVGDDLELDEPAPGHRIASGLSLSASPDLLRRLLDPESSTTHPIDRRLLRLGAGPARSRARRIRLAAERCRQRSDLQHAARAHVGGRDSSPGRRPRVAADVEGSALSRS